MNHESQPALKILHTWYVWIGVKYSSISLMASHCTETETETETENNGRMFCWLTCFQFLRYTCGKSYGFSLHMRPDGVRLLSFTWAAVTERCWMYDTAIDEEKWGQCGDTLTAIFDQAVIMHIFYSEVKEKKTLHKNMLMYSSYCNCSIQFYSVLYYNIYYNTSSL